ncbi:hypothetical protein Bcav_0862 [Beutenbergia cavernae DSM 12333]|uniref:Transcriptional regulator, TetR family n=1 Tax=Beutenbergia cavernae (strain ATCC BAA-8 / DSM 12333 / CCUG 43141 / JCM 11478 / NBRC 16432 / NCIMB 13614 / HKI 0122) TaxID=471853 RepID=C5BZF1_BEUC1|nr:hypothetical protein [Beutenbergia cavernae]ACQ79123.1 hypothetical protein Bcav_0862 [Beutenbergia cavernae DSM 12333]
MASQGRLDEAVEESATRLDVLDAVIDVLADAGRVAVTFDRVDDEARLPQGTAAGLYRSEDQLLVATAGRVVERLRQRLNTGGLLPLDPAPYGEVVRTAAAGVDHVVTEARADLLALQGLRGVKLTPDDEIDLCDRAVRAFARSVARAVIDMGLARSSEDVVAFFEAMVDVTWAHLERGLSRPELERRIARALERYLMPTRNLRLVGGPGVDEGEDASVTVRGASPRSSRGVG